MKKVVLFLVALAMAIPCAVGFAADEAAAPAEVVYGKNVGDLSKPVELKSIDGKGSVKTDALGKPTVFMLVSSVCTACMAELREVSANLDAITKTKNVYAVVIDMDPARAAESMSKFNLPLLSDSEWVLGGSVGLNSAPGTVVLSPEGKILSKKFGYSLGGFRELIK
jgi:cytochrome oxidase Cu insertion factor (SCO1/SenC/PrrC family)